MHTDVAQLIFGHDPFPGLIACERGTGKHGEDEMVLFARRNGRVEKMLESFRPYLWLAAPDQIDVKVVKAEFTELKGRGVMRYLAEFASWKDFQKAATALKRSAEPYYAVNDPVQQFLMRTGRTSFKDMAWREVRRMQVDIETYSESGFDFSNADREGDRIIAIALADESGWTEVINGAQHDERAMLEQFVARVRERDPDVLEGHNLFKFDLPYLIARARRHKVKLKIGRNDAEPRVTSGRFMSADRTIAYPKIEIHGRHVLDTFFMAQIYDTTHRSLEGFGLKEVADHFGVAAPDRTYLDGSEIARTFDRDPDKVMAYALDDIRETRAISNLLSPVYFAQAQIAPMSYQSVVVRGNGSKVDALLIREYLRQGCALPVPDTVRDFAGGYTDVFFTGVARNVHHCDVRSLYPSLMLTRRIGPRSDELGVFLHLLEYLRSVRVDAKAQWNDATNEDRSYYDALQTAFKVLINSFYGYLGFGQARFSDFDMAERVAAEGRNILQQMLDWIRKEGGQPIEIDTDGIYFVPPEFKSDADLESFRHRFQESLPEGIEIEFDGVYRSMFSYKMKNYALLDDDGGLMIKGAALKSRGLEPFQREFLREILRLILEERADDIPRLGERYRSAIRNGEWDIHQLAKTETLQDAPSTYRDKIQGKSRGRNAAYELALRSGRDYRAGDQVSYYVTGTKKSVAVHEFAKPVSEWDPDNRDENIAYYLAKLDALAGKFDAELSGGDDDRQGELWSTEETESPD